MIIKAAAWLACLILATIVAFQCRNTARLQHDIERRDTVISMSRLEIESFARHLAEEQMRLNRATYLTAGMPRQNTNTVHGLPVIQLGCIVNWPETWFISAYDKVLDEQGSVRQEKLE